MHRTAIIGLVALVAALPLRSQDQIAGRSDDRPQPPPLPPEEIRAPLAPAAAHAPLAPEAPRPPCRLAFAALSSRDESAS